MGKVVTKICPSIGLVVPIQLLPLLKWQRQWVTSTIVTKHFPNAPNVWELYIYIFTYTNGLDLW